VLCYNYYMLRADIAFLLFSGGLIGALGLEG
jgi:hypothetical protein